MLEYLESQSPSFIAELQINVVFYSITVVKSRPYLSLASLDMEFVKV